MKSLNFVRHLSAYSSSVKLGSALGSRFKTRNGRSIDVHSQPCGFVSGGIQVIVISSTLFLSGTVTCHIDSTLGVPDVLRVLHFFLREAQSIYECLMPDVR